MPVSHIDRFYPWRLGLIAVVSASWLLGPKPQSAKDFCGTRMEVNSWIGTTINCDSATFVNLARHPSDLFKPYQVRQSRPVFVLMGAVVGTPLAAVARAFDLGEGETASYHVGYVALNFLFLSMAVELLAALLLRVGVSPSETLVLSVFLVANDLTKAFVWTAHTQLLGLSIPLVTLALAGRWRRNPPRGFGPVVLAGALTGLAILAYGGFIVSLAVWGLTLLRADRRAKRSWFGSLSRVGVFGTSAILPVVAWPLVVRHLTGFYYSHEIEQYRQFVWMADAAAQGLPVFYAEATTNLRKFLQTLGSPEVGPLLVFFLGLYAMSKAGSRGSMGPLTAERRAVAMDVAVYLAVAIPFLVLVGYYAVRLTYMIIPPLIVLAGLALPELKPQRRRVAVCGALAAVGGAWWLYHAGKMGPFS